jgi:hypothetical protein
MIVQLLELIFFYVPQALNCFFDGGEFLEEKKGTMAVQEAGRRGDLKTSETHGEVFYSEISRKRGKIGGPKRDRRVRNLILEGKEHEQE